MIIAGLEVNERLKSLDVSSNEITNDGLDALYSCLIHSNETITRLATIVLISYFHPPLTSLYME